LGETRIDELKVSNNGYELDIYLQINPDYRHLFHNVDRMCKIKRETHTPFDIVKLPTIEDLNNK